MKALLDGNQIGVVYFTAPVNVGGRSAQSIGAGEAVFTPLGGWGLAIEARTGGPATVVPMSAIERIELLRAGAELPVAKQFTAPPPMPVQAPAAPREPPITPHEFQARAAKEERMRLAAERGRANEPTSPAPAAAPAPPGEIVMDEFGRYSRKMPTPSPPIDEPAVQATQYRPGRARRAPGPGEKGGGA